MSNAARGHLAMLVFSALVAGSFSLGVMIANDIAPAALNALRFALAAGLVGAPLEYREAKTACLALPTLNPWAARGGCRSRHSIGCV